jgi:glycosyltransferase involved in cell wall biosynthesis
MKVLHIAPSLSPSYGGPTQSLLGYVVAGRAAGAEVSVATPACAPEDADAALAAGIEPSRLHFFRAYGRNAFSTSPQLVRWAARNARLYDVVHVHGLLNPVSSLAARACMREGAPVAIRPFGTLSRYTFTHRRTALKRLYFSAVEANNLRRADALHFTTVAERDEAAWHGLDYEGRAHIVPPPWIPSRDLASSAWSPAPAAALFLSRLHPVKNVEALLDSWVAVVERLPHTRLVIAGDGEARYVQTLKRRAESLGIAASVEFAGFVAGAAKSKLFSDAAVFVLPSHHENFGMAALEAIGAGLPVIVTPEVQLSPFIKEHGLGIVVPPDPRRLTEAIVGALADGELRAHVRAAGPMALAESFGPAVVGQQLIKMYDAAIAGQRLNRH